MQFFQAAMLSALLLVAASHDAATKSLSVQKVIDLLDELAQKGQEEMHAEEVQWATYKTFCEETVGHKFLSIESDANQISMLEAEIEVASARIQKLDKEIAEHQKDVTIWEQDQSALHKIADMQEGDYQAMHQDYTESIGALQGAVMAVQAQEDKEHPEAIVSMTQLTSLRQVRRIPAEDMRKLELFFAHGVQSEDPEVKVYEFQSGKIVDILEELLVKFSDELTAVEKLETERIHKYDTTNADLTNQIEAANKDILRKEEEKAATTSHKATQEGLLGDTQSSQSADHTYVTDLQSTCESKASDFDARRALREEEIKSINKAIAILSSDLVAGAGEKHLSAMIQTKRIVLVAMRGALTPDGGNLRMAHDFLVEQAHKLDSQALESLVAKLSEDDPMAKVVKMIQDLIFRLQNEEAHDADHEAWCDTELAANSETRSDLETKNQSLHAKVDSLEATIATLSAEVAQLFQEVTELDAEMLNATSMRAAEKTTNTETIEEAQKAQAAVVQATALLKEFYSAAEGATALVQHQQQPIAPEIFDSPYTGMHEEGEGIISLLDMLAGEFTTLEAETENEEKKAVQAYEKMMQDSTVSKTSKTKDIEYKSAMIKDETKTLGDVKMDKEANRKELYLANEYYDKLKPSCVDEERYDEYKAARDDEIESLQHALKILGSNTTAV